MRFYNEVFKFLDQRNGLEDFYYEISRHQDFQCLKLFKEKGLKGVEEYYVKIRVEDGPRAEGPRADPADKTPCQSRKGPGQ